MKQAQFDRIEALLTDILEELKMAPIEPASERIDMQPYLDALKKQEAPRRPSSPGEWAVERLGAGKASVETFQSIVEESQETRDHKALLRRSLDEAWERKYALDRLIKEEEALGATRKEGE